MNTPKHKHETGLDTSRYRYMEGLEKLRGVKTSLFVCKVSENKPRLLQKFVLEFLVKHFIT